MLSISSSAAGVCICSQYISQASASFFFNDSAPTDIYTLSLHDALPISEPDVRPIGKMCYSDSELRAQLCDWLILCPTDLIDIIMEYNPAHPLGEFLRKWGKKGASNGDRKSTRLNSSHEWISYAVFCLKK